jgi:SRSO17 transposase
MAQEREFSASERRFQQYLDRLMAVIGHADRAQPLRDYCTGLLLPGERKSVEPMAARLQPDNVRQWHQSLHHFVATAPWNEQAVLAAVREYCLPLMQQPAGIQAWIVDDTGFPKKGHHSVGVARQYCGQLGKQDNCQVAVSLSVAHQQASLPVAYQLYLPESWAKDKQRRREAGVPEEAVFRTKPEMALEQIRWAVQEELPRGVVLADAAYGNDTAFREGISALGLRYVVGVQETMTVWPRGRVPLSPRRHPGRGRPPTRLRRDEKHQPVSVAELASLLPASAFHRVSWREGTAGVLRSRFAAVRVRPAHRDHLRQQVRAEEWLLVEWPEGSAEPIKYWLSTLPASTSLHRLVQYAHLRWRVERDYQELKQELGLGHFEGRGWRGFHHHATLCLAAYAFLVAERTAFPPSGDLPWRSQQTPRLPPGFQARGSPRQSRTA